MKKMKLDLPFWFKLTFLLIIIGAYVSIRMIAPIRVESVRAATDQAAEIGFNKGSGFIAVKNSSIMSGNGGGDWIYLVTGNSVEKTPVKLGTADGEYVEITSGLLMKDTYVLNPPKKDADLAAFPVDWRFDY